MRSVTNIASRWICAVLLSCLVMYSSMAKADSKSDLYQQAAALYKQNQFDKAAEDYENILKQGGKTAEVYYNLGNCYYKSGNLGLAILNYERASKLAPEDEDIIHNLKLAQLHLEDKVQAVPQLGIVAWCNNLVASQPVNNWATFALVAVWLGFVLFAALLFVSSFKGALRFGAISMLLLSVVFLFFSRAQQHNIHQCNYAVLTADNTFAKSAPDGAANNAFQIHEGIKFLVLDHVGEWNKIRLADGKVGWIQNGNFEKI